MLLSILEKNLGSSIHKSGENYAFKCPFCNHQKNKLEIDISTQLWNCWVCGSRGKSVSSLFYKLGINSQEIKQFPANKKLEKQKVVSNISMPEDSKPSYIKTNAWGFNRVDEYLTSRGVTYNDRKKHNIHYTLSGKYENMVIIPNYDIENKLNFFSGRSFLGCDRKLSPAVSKDIIGFENTLDFKQPVILVEGPFDAITVRYNASPLYGKFMSKNLKREIIINRTTIYSSLDSDAILESIDMWNYLISNGITVYHVEIPENSDPNSLGYDNFWRLMDKAKIIDLDYIYYKKKGNNE
jgi:transcription elongation factor Elf1